MKINKKSILFGTAILTATGFASRIIGFFYRIFLSQQFGEEGMGLFQLTSPVLSFSYAIAISGIQTAISKYVAEKINDKANDKFKILLTGLTLSVSIASVCSFVLYYFSNQISATLLNEIRCAPLVRILALSLPFAALHSCINGYFLGKKSTAVPASSQLIEQVFRVASVIIISSLIIRRGYTPSLSLTALGLLIGEVASCIFSFLFLWKDCSAIEVFNKTTLTLKSNLSALLKMSVPLSINRIIVTVFLSVETVNLPIQLQLFGFTNSEALKYYGVLTGMVLPLILFPSAITNSLSVLLLPTVSEAQSDHKTDKIQKITQKTFLYCFLMGLCCTLIFFFEGKMIGNLLFHSDIAGEFIMKMSCICPLIYITSALGGIINGLGKVKSTLCIQIIGLSIRLLFVFCIVKRLGINGYFLGLIISQFASCIHSMLVLQSYFKKNVYNDSSYPTLADSFE